MRAIAFTGSGGGPIAGQAGAPHINELVAQTRAVSEYHPGARTVIEIGGQEHFYLEGQSAMVLPQEGGDMIVHSSSQHPTEIQHKVADALGLRGWARMRWLVLPRLRNSLGFAAGLTAALSMGDLGVVVLFADPQLATLPLQMYRLMAAYQMEAAQGAAFLLLILSLGLFWAFDRGGRRDAGV